MLSGLFKNIVSQWRSARIRDAALKRARRVIGLSGMFDNEWYLQRYPDVAAAGLDALKHFILHGGREGRSPGPRFDAAWYLRKNADVARSGVNPLVHYLDHGRGEGRSIKALVPGALDETAEAQWNEKGLSQSKDASPYVSDYAAGWRSMLFDWRSLAAATKDSQSSAINCAADPNDFLSGLPESGVRSRIELFLGLQRAVGTAAQRCDLPQEGLGLDRITDGWFATARQLLLRLNDPLAGAVHLVGFQIGNAGAVQQVASQPARGSSGLVRLDLENPLGPVLLLWQGTDGTPLEAALVPFPSLYRGGLHYAEVLAVAKLASESTSVADYMVELAHELFGCDRLLLGRILVQLQGANGSEAIFQPAVVQGLAAHFGLTLDAGVAVHGADSPAERLRSTFPNATFAERRQSSAELVLPPDCIPSLAALCSLVTSQRIGAASIAVVLQGHPQRMVLACLSRTNAATVDMAHPALPSPVQIWRCAETGAPTPLDTAGLPGAIRTMDSTVWQVDSLVPLSPDVAIPEVAESHSALASICVILSHSGTPQELALSLAAIAGQSAVRVSEIVLLTETPELPPFTNIDVPIRRLPPFELANSGSFIDDPERLVIFLDSSVFPHDPRTFAVMARLCCVKGIGAATCASVASLPEEEGDERAAVSWVADLTDDPAVPAGELIATLFPAATFDVAAADPRILAVRGEVWRSLLADKAVPEDTIGLAWALTHKCQQKGLATVATTLVRVATSSADLTLPGQSAAVSKLFADAERHKIATHLIRLMP